ncbi:MAG TPA: phosphatidylserine/phosphatidylglycerophosphate/cardiolipin synthase family protein [Verrucomicrobiae bacterium]|jgi:cardiolipin synthase|nr:phosphatidylserine/phosphatidylglycerophosphate/cardiolipin synthase family protein [Verrucomicrobiae bacterium]
MTAPLEWLSVGTKNFPAMLDAIGGARVSVRLETYIYADGRLGRLFADALLAATGRGVQVSVLVDDFGSWSLPANYFDALIAAGARVRRFNRLSFWRFAVRDHRKLLVCDDQVAFVGGFNISDEYDGDGIACGWCDVGARIENPELVAALAASFDQLLTFAEPHSRPLRRFFVRRQSVFQCDDPPLRHPNSKHSSFSKLLRRDLARARDVRIVSAYFLPTYRLRRALMHAARRGGRVRLILPGKTDVPISKLAARNFYKRLMQAGVEIYEYEPQILHAKLISIGNVTYVGSANLDIRSLRLNFELVIRFQDKAIAAGADEVFENILAHSHRIEPATWHANQAWWQRLKYRWANFLLTRVDPYVALQQFRERR